MKKNLIPLYFVIASTVIGVAFFAFYTFQDLNKSQPKIKLSYYQSVSEIADGILQKLEHELRDQNQFWIGVEPNKADHLALAEEMILKLKAQNKIDDVFVDEQLGLDEQQLAAFAMAFPDFKIIPVKDNWYDLADFAKKGELDRAAILTAAIYSTSMLPKNPIDKIKTDAVEYKPMAFSMGHFTIDAADEKNLTFPCMTEDRSGTQTWACGILNKARSQRRRIQPLAEVANKPFLGLMDLTGEKDYMILLTKR